VPQITIEYSANLGTAFQARSFARRVHDHVVATIDTQLASCKTRLVELQETVIGDGSNDNAMIHVDLRILSGRSAEQKRQLGESVMAELGDAVGKPAHLNLQLTVEIRDLDRDHYHKRQL
jgi:5-carboxymethyl-2-hydroxymuconate isomerase